MIDFDAIRSEKGREVAEKVERQVGDVNHTYHGRLRQPQISKVIEDAFDPEVDNRV